MSTILKVTLLVLVALLHQGSALRCWVCSSDSSPECGDPISQTEHNRNFQTRDCDSISSSNPYTQHERSVCQKTVQMTNGKKIVIRSCHIPLPEERGISDGVCSSSTLSASYTNIESCHICSTDLCNGAYSTLGQISTMTSLIFFGIPSVLFAYRWCY